MFQDPLPRPIFAKQNRRQFLAAFAGAGVGMVLAGCSGGGGVGTSSPSGSSSTSGGGGVDPGPDPGPLPAADSLPPVPISGTVNTSEIGGTGLNVVSIFEPVGPVGGGTFGTSVSPNLVQTLIVFDQAGAARGMVVNLPKDGSPGTPTIDATSTAVALVFLSPGIGTSEVNLAEERITLILAAPSFPDLVADLAALLPTLTLPQALAQVQAELLAVMTEVPVEFPATRFLGRTAEEQLLVNRDGGLFLERDLESPYTRMQIGLNNEGWRFLSVVRQDKDFEGNQIRVEVPQLDGSPTAGRPSVVQGINGVSFGSLFTQASLAAGTATDAVNTETPLISNITYWARGLGNPLLPISETLPASIRDEDFVGVAEGLTVAYYFLLPFLEPFIAAGKSLGLTGVTTLESIFTSAGLGAAGLSVQAALNTGNEGNINLALVDACKELMVIGAGGLAAFAAGLAGSAALTGPAAALLVAAEAVLGTLSLVFSTYNFTKAAKYIVGVPRYSTVDVGFPGPKFLALLGPAGAIELRSLNENGTVLYNGPGGFFLRRLGTEPLRLFDADERGEGVLNRKDEAVIQDLNHARHALYRLVSGETIPLLPPALISATPTATGVVGISNASHALLTFDRDNGQGGSVVDLFFGSRAGDPSDPVGMSTAKPGNPGPFMPNSALSSRGVVNDQEFITHTSAGGTRFRVRGPYGGALQFTPFSSFDGYFDDVYMDMNASGQKLVQKFALSGNSFVGYKESSEVLLESPSGARTSVVAETDVEVGTPGEGFYSRSRVTGCSLNDAGEALVHYLHTPVDGPQEQKVLVFSASGFPQDVVAELPPGAPAGPWQPLAMRGRFLVMADADGNTYLYHRGR